MASVTHEGKNDTHVGLGVPRFTRRMLHRGIVAGTESRRVPPPDSRARGLKKEMMAGVI